jgi:hypothetical protein
MPTDKPDVLQILADDNGRFDAGAYHRGMAPPDFNPQAIVDKVVNAAAQRHGN